MPWLADLLQPVECQLVVAALIFMATMGLIAFCVPGVMIPMAMSSGALVGPWLAGATVVLGAFAGSQLLFLFSRRLAKDRVRRKLGKRLDLFERQFAKHGLLYVIGLRIVGAPHFLVTAGSALMPMKSWTFGLATFIGMLPVIALAAVAGAAL
jgi:uncharacterized membrane protein YdjX (TVP38/TMEM64 family)